MAKAASAATRTSVADIEATQRAGWQPGTWCRDVSISRALFYRLPLEHQPHSVKVGKRRIIRESPSAWLTRMASAQEAT